MSYREEPTPRSTTEDLIEGIIEPETEGQIQIPGEVVSETRTELVDGNTLEQELMNQAQKGSKQTSPTPESHVPAFEQASLSRYPQDFSRPMPDFSQRMNSNLAESLRGIICW